MSMLNFVSVYLLVWVGVFVRFMFVCQCLSEGGILLCPMSTVLVLAGDDCPIVANGAEHAGHTLHAILVFERAERSLPLLHAALVGRIVVVRHLAWY